MRLDPKRTCANSCADMKEHFVIDPLISKRQQLLLATQLCRMVLKVCNVLYFFFVSLCGWSHTICFLHKHAVSRHHRTSPCFSFLLAVRVCIAGGGEAGSEKRVARSGRRRGLHAARRVVDCMLRAITPRPDRPSASLASCPTFAFTYPCYLRSGFVKR